MRKQINMEDAAYILQKELGNATIRNCRDYRGYYVFCAIDNSNPSETVNGRKLVMDPFYAVDKKTGKVSRFIPAALGKPSDFFKIMPIEVTYE